MTTFTHTSGGGSDDAGIVRAGDLLRIERQVTPSSAADVSFARHGSLEHGSRRPSHHSTRTGVVPSNTSPSSDHGAAVPEPGGCAELREMSRSALRNALRAGEAAPDGEVRRMLRDTCSAARARNMSAEHVLILLKEGWRVLPEAPGRRDAEAQARLARIVTLCIEEYYGAPPRRR